MIYAHDLAVAFSILILAGCVSAGREDEHVVQDVPLAGTHDGAAVGAGPVRVLPKPGAPVIRQQDCVPSQMTETGEDVRPSAEVGVETNVGSPEGTPRTVTPYTRSGCAVH
jgi:hypothetical protein